MTAGAIAQPVAMILGSLTGGLILDHINWFGLSGWRWVFILQGLPAVLVGLVVLAYLPNKPGQARFLSREASEWLETEINKDYAPEQKETFLGQLRVMKDRKVLYMAFANLFAACGLYGFTFFLPQIVKQMDPSYSATNIGFLGVIPWLVGAVGMLLVRATPTGRGSGAGTSSR